MADNNQYNLGYDFFQDKNNEVLSNDQLKQMHPLFRRGYRTAQEDYMKKHNRNFPTVLADIPKKSDVFVPTWNDIMAATRRPRFAKLHNTPELKPMLNEIVNSVEKRTHRIKRYSDIIRLVNEALDTILQHGYDIGILDEHDLSKYDYVPK